MANSVDSDRRLQVVYDLELHYLQMHVCPNT